MLLLVIIGYFGYQQYIKKPKADVAVQEYGSSASYSGTRFSFSYPKEYTLAETPEGVRLTSATFPQEERKACLAISDEERRIFCLEKLLKLSPNILITFLPGNASTLWESKKIGEEADSMFATNQNTTYRVNEVGGEYGGRGSYGLLLSDGLLLATYDHEDMPGGVPFSALKSDTYHLDKDEQKKLLEDILQTLAVTKQESNIVTTEAKTITKND